MLRSYCAIAIAAMTMAACGGPQAVVENNVHVETTAVQKDTDDSPPDLSLMSERWQRWFAKQSCPRDPIGRSEADVPCKIDGCPIRLTKQRFWNKKTKRTETLYLPVTKKNTVTTAVWEAHVNHSRPADICPVVPERTNHGSTSNEEEELPPCEIGEPNQ